MDQFNKDDTELNESEEVIYKEITLISNDEKEYKISSELLKDSETIQGLIDNVGLENTSIPLPNIDSKILEKIIYYLEYTNNKELSPEEKTNKEKELLDIDDDTMFNLILGCNYLQLNNLLDKCCKVVADIIKECKNPEEIRKRFNIKNDFTPEEEEEIIRENSWLNN